MTEGQIGMIVGAAAAILGGIIGGYAQGGAWYWFEGKRATREKKANELRRLEQQKNLVQILRAEIKELLEAVAHNHALRGAFIELSAETCREAFFRADPVLPFDKELLKAVSTLLIQIREVNTRIQLYHQDRTTYTKYKKAIVEMCAKEPPPSDGETKRPYALPHTLDLVDLHLHRLEDKLGKSA